MERMSKQALIDALANDPALRAKFMQSASQFYEDIGLEMTPDDAERIRDQTLASLAGRLDANDARALVIVWPTIFSKVETGEQDQI